VIFRFAVGVKQVLRRCGAVREVDQFREELSLKIVIDPKPLPIYSSVWRGDLTLVLRARRECGVTGRLAGGVSIDCRPDKYAPVSEFSAAATARRSP